MSLRIVELMEAARNCVRGFTNVQPGENVLILTDTTGFADPLVVEAMALACKEVGADVVVATSKPWEPRVEDPPKIIQNAFFAANTVFSITPGEATLHSRTGRIAVIEYGTKLMAVVANTADLMASEWARFPVDLFWIIMRKVYEKVSRGKTIRVTSPAGTDCSAGIHPDHFMGFPTDTTGAPAPPIKGDSTYSMFPFGVFGVIPQPPANGVIVFDALLGFKGLLKEPVKVTMKDNWLTKIEGGDEAKWFQNFIAEKKRKGIEADYWIEIMWGINPKASIQRGLELTHLRESELTRRAGTIHFGIGKSGSGFHWDGILIKPFSVFIDGEPIIENCRLTALDDPEVRKVAKQFGDPDKLLTEVP